MKLDTARMRSWTLKGALPVAALASVLHTGGAVGGMILWLITGLVLRDGEQTPYVRRISPLREGARAFLALSIGVACLSAIWLLIGRFSSLNQWTRSFSLTGAVCLSQCAVCALQDIRLSPFPAMALGAFMMVIALPVLI